MDFICFYIPEQYLVQGRSLIKKSGIIYLSFRYFCEPHRRMQTAGSLWCARHGVSHWRLSSEIYKIPEQERHSYTNKEGVRSFKNYHNSLQWYKAEDCGQ